MASFMNEHFNPFIPVEGNQILVASGITGILNMLAFSLGDPGDAVLVSTPVYGRFELDFNNEARLRIVYARMEGLDSFEEGVVERFEEAMKEAEASGTRIRALMISNPSNPLGEFSL
jgi:bifunctional pyridoxal-dependent enzyme with beta-cystathionase and maltose regulon repressor activities